MELETTCNFSYCAKPEVEVVESDLCIIGGGMSACGAAYEACSWANAKGLKVVMVDKAATDRSGAVAMGLSAINTYLGENSSDDYVRYVRGDLMGIIREDLVKDLGQHVDDSVHLFEEWGLPIWKLGDDGFSMDGAQAKAAGKPMLKDGGTPVRSGKWQIMINGESYKVIVAEAAKAALETNRQATGMDQNLYERVFVVKMYKDANGRAAAAAGFREQDIHLQGQGLHKRRRRCCERLQAQVHCRRPGQGMVPCMELRLGLCPGYAGGCRADPHGEQVRARQVQGRLRPSGCVVPLLQGPGPDRNR